MLLLYNNMSSGIVTIWLYMEHIKMKNEFLKNMFLKYITLFGFIELCY